MSQFRRLAIITVFVVIPAVSSVAALTATHTHIAPSSKFTESENALAETALGYRYTTGKGVPQNYVKAAYWCRKGAAQGNAEAEALLGSLYANGHGVP